MGLGPSPPAWPTKSWTPSRRCRLRTPVSSHFYMRSASGDARTSRSPSALQHPLPPSCRRARKSPCCAALFCGANGCLANPLGEQDHRQVRLRDIFKRMVARICHKSRIKCGLRASFTHVYHRPGDLRPSEGQAHGRLPADKISLESDTRQRSGQSAHRRGVQMRLRRWQAPRRTRRLRPPGLPRPDSRGTTASQS